MNKYWEETIQKDLKGKKKNSLYRSLKPIEKTAGRQIILHGKTLINFSSNDYLGLTQDKRITEAGHKFALEFGNGSGASRLVTGTYKPYLDIEQALAGWAGKPSGLVFNSGYHANIGLLSALASRDTVVFTDRLNHASIYDGLILSRAVMARYAHNDMEDLKNQLLKYKDHKKKILITDSVFSMDGDRARLEEIAALCRENNVLSIVDEAHSFGLFGKNGNGLVNELGISDEIDIIMGTLGKSFGIFGAFALSSKNMIYHLINNCRPFIFTTALPPFVFGCIEEGLRIIQTESRGIKVLCLADKLRRLLNDEGINTLDSQSQIIPVVTGENDRALSLMEHLNRCGFHAGAIRPPTVPEHTSRVRLSVSFFHTEDDINGIYEAVKTWFKKENER